MAEAERPGYDELSGIPMRASTLALLLICGLVIPARAETAPFSADNAMKQIAAIAGKKGASATFKNRGCKDNKGQRGCNFLALGELSYNFISKPDGEFIAAMVDGPKILDKDGAYLDATIQVIDPSLMAEQRKKFVGDSLSRYRQNPPKGGPIVVSSATFRFNMLIFNKQTVTFTIVPLDVSRIRKKEPGE
jgi:hypothetical protein